MSNGSGITLNDAKETVALLKEIKTAMDENKEKLELYMERLKEAVSKSALDEIAAIKEDAKNTLRDIDKHMKESDLQLTMLGIFVLTVAILVSIHAATYMTPRDFIVTVGGNVLLVLVGGWVLAHLPSIHGP